LFNWHSFVVYLQQAMLDLAFVIMECAYCRHGRLPVTEVP